MNRKENTEHLVHVLTQHSLHILSWWLCWEMSANQFDKTATTESDLLHKILGNQ